MNGFIPQVSVRSGTAFGYLFESAPDCMQLVRRCDGQVLAVNAAWKQWFGQDRFDGDLKFQELLSSDSIAIFEDLVEANASGEPLPSRTLRVIGADKRPRLVEASFLPSGGELCVVFRAFETRDNPPAQELKAMLNAFPDVLIVLDKNGVYRHIYTDDDSQLVAAPSEMLGRSIADVLQPDEAKVGLDTIWQVLSSGEKASLEYSIRIDGRTCWFSAMAVPFRSEGEPCVMWVCRNITELVEAREANRRDQELLRNISQLQEMKLNLIASDIHDGLVQDMTGVQMWLESLTADDDNVIMMRRALRDAISEARQLMNDLRPLLTDESRLEEGLWNLVADFAQRASFQIDLQQSTELGAVTSLLKKTVLRLIRESLHNAHRHSKAKCVTVRVNRFDDHLRIQVMDDGVGFDVESVAPSRFGLESIRKRAMVFGGSADIASSPGEGTTIDVELPISPDV